MGSVIVQVTAPVGWVAPAIPVTVVVSVTVPPSCGFADEAHEMTGVCLANVSVNGELVWVL